ncbi:MAG: hypothetical protein DRJ66_04350 [Thermoprotei archaeon]|nr:MAG: hypothetical protein DRJ66_04350 [Thermoprotei archaeon]
MYVIEAVYLEAFVHATESRSKVVRALLSLIPESLHPIIKIVEDKVKGHYGNPIRILRIMIQGGKNAEATVRYLASRLSEDDKKLLSSTFENRISADGKLYLRFDKQYASFGELRLALSEDVIKVVISFRHGVSLKKVCKDLGLIL